MRCGELPLLRLGLGMLPLRLGFCLQLAPALRHLRGETCLERALVLVLLVAPAPVENRRGEHVVEDLVARVRRLVGGRRHAAQDAERPSEAFQHRCELGDGRVGIGRQIAGA